MQLNHMQVKKIQAYVHMIRRELLGKALRGIFFAIVGNLTELWFWAFRLAWWWLRKRPMAPWWEHGDAIPLHPLAVSNGGGCGSTCRRPWPTLIDVYLLDNDGVRLPSPRQWFKPVTCSPIPSLLCSNRLDDMTRIWRTLVSVYLLLDDDGVWLPSPRQWSKPATCSPIPSQLCSNNLESWWHGQGRNCRQRRPLYSPSPPWRWCHGLDRPFG